MGRIPADRTTSAEPLQWLVRVGFLARGLTYGVIGGLAVALALGAGTDGKAPNQQGALGLVAGAPLGKVALAVAATGLLAYAGWKLLQGVRGHGPEGGGGHGAFDRVANLAGGIVYLAFFALAVRVLVQGGGSGRQSSAEPHHAAAGVLGWPGGRFIVGVAGIVLIAISLHQAYTALSGRFLDDLKTTEMGGEERGVLTVVGRTGLLARTFVFAVCGYFLIRTAVDFRAGSAVGVDGALERLHQQALGPWMVGLVGVGLLVFAAFSLAEARYRRL